MCKTTPWFTEEDNLCFRQGKAASARGVVFPSLLFTARGRFLLWSAWLLCPSYTSAHWSVGRQTASSCAHSQAFSTSFSAFPVLSLSLRALFLLSLHCIWFHLSLSLPTPYTSFFFFFSQACSLPRYLSLCQGPNVGLQMKQLDFHLRLPGINMCCSLSGRTLSTSPMLSRGRMAKQMKRPQLLARKHRTKGDIIQLFSVRIYYIIWAANNSDKITWL